MLTENIFPSVAWQIYQSTTLGFHFIGHSRWAAIHVPSHWEKEAELAGAAGYMTFYYIF